VKYAGVVWAVSAALAAGAASASGSPSGAVQARVLVNPLSVVVLVPSDPVKAGRNFRIRAEVTNASSSALRNVAVALVAPQALVVRDPATQVLPRVGPGADRRARWDACTTAAGGYVVMARATVGLFTSESAGQLVQVESAQRPSC
jgi:hypothetical protein